MANSKLIFSTDDSVSLTNNTVQSLAIDPSKQRVRLHLDRKGGGKIV